KRVDGEIAKLKEEEASLTQNREQAEEDSKSREEAIGALRLEMAALEQKATELDVKTEKLRWEKEQQSASHKSFFGRREELSARMGQLDRELFRLDSQKEKLDEAGTNLSDHMWSEYELTYNAALALQRENHPGLTELKKNRGTVKEEIRELGNVNVNAIDDYKEVSERFTFMDAQRRDLE
ncbi:MAG: chromosome segregation protein SMC, partial [Lachnospiraceae bacterium]|nr:chromosome segregation protein SMC [Lachnospiraceae bacterium]